MRKGLVHFLGTSAFKNVIIDHLKALEESSSEVTLVKLCNSSFDATNFVNLVVPLSGLANFKIFGSYLGNFSFKCHLSKENIGGNCQHLSLD